MKSDIPTKVHFEPSTIENIDKSVYDFVYGLKLATDTNEGFNQVPVLWGTSERSFLSKKEEGERDTQGLLKLPLISIRRTSFVKDMKSKGIFQGNVPEVPDEQGGSLVVSRRINQEKTTAYAKSTAKRRTQDSSYPIKNNKIDYQTISAPMPVNVEMS